MQFWVRVDRSASQWVTGKGVSRSGRPLDGRWAVDQVNIDCADAQP
jgi:hypothetical protein